ncbi:hypothetical protein M885DRAFT_532342 [Pelagophyceae sp. CCMP2097]|nr:hypothetical protein M885DRAFT_532342 [Pelagophyceae sp. CCMP2097]|mmetsp:Transcript_1201/g.3716  ORF Transcript_1201/g.3716 Transcript_1201/m.3716 type:complete len:293 (-) Transcript_1201:139-1017(-)
MKANNVLRAVNDNLLRTPVLKRLQPLRTAPHTSGRENDLDGYTPQRATPAAKRRRASKSPQRTPRAATRVTPVQPQRLPPTTPTDAPTTDDAIALEARIAAEDAATATEDAATSFLEADDALVATAEAAAEAEPRTIDAPAASALLPFAVLCLYVFAILAGWRLAGPALGSLSAPLAGLAAPQRAVAAARNAQLLLGAPTASSLATASSLGSAGVALVRARGGSLLYYGTSVLPALFADQLPALFADQLPAAAPRAASRAARALVDKLIHAARRVCDLLQFWRTTPAAQTKR